MNLPNNVIMAIWVTSAGKFRVVSTFPPMVWWPWPIFIREYVTSVFHPRPVLAPSIVVACVCPSVSQSVSPVHQSVRPSVTKFFRTITHHPFMLGSTNLDHRCRKTLVKIPIVFVGDRPWPLRSNLTSESSKLLACTVQFGKVVGFVSIAVQSIWDRSRI